MTQFAVIHLPVKDNDGVSLEAENNEVLRQLAEKWGGFTVTPASGGWVDNNKLYRDVVLRVLVAGVDNKADWFELAEQVKKTHRQLSVYVEFYTGEVHFV